MKKNKLLLAVFMLIMVLGACKREGQQQPSGGSDRSAAEADTNKASLMWWGDEPRHIATQKAIDEFVKANPGKNITPLPTPFDGYHDKIIIQLSGGTAPDLFCFSSEWMAEVGFAKNPVLKDLKELPIDFSNLSSTLLAGGTINGKLLGIPTGVSGWSFNYNKNVLTEFAKKSGRGLPPGPGEKWTIDEMIDYARAFKQTMGPDYAMVVTSRDQLSHLLVSMMSEIAGKFYVSEKAELVATEQNILDTFKLFSRFTEAGVLPAPALQVESLGESTVGTINVASGKWAGWFSWTSNIPQNAVSSNSEIGIMAFPIVGRPEYDGLFVRPAQFWSIANNSKNQATAAQLLDFIVNNDKAIAALELQRSVPPTEKGQKVLADLGILSGPTYDSTAYLMRIAGAPYTPFILIPELTEALRNEYTKYITGNNTAEAAAKALYNDWQRMLVSIRRANGL
jgi:ABC-type glycerol-3-phosphate transport system substrate-binding protein